MISYKWNAVVCLISQLLNMVNNTIDKFGRRRQKTNTLSIRGQTGIGFKLTRDGHYDIQRKRLKNVGDPADSRDSATREYVDKSIKNFQLAFQDYGRRDAVKLQKDISDIKKSIVLLAEHIHSMEEKQKRIYRTNTPTALTGSKSGPLSILDELRQKGIVFLEEHL